MKALPLGTAHTNTHIRLQPHLDQHLHAGAAPHHKAQGEAEHDAHGGPPHLHNEWLTLQRGGVGWGGATLVERMQGPHREHVR